MNVVEINDVYKTYHDTEVEVRAVNGVTLSFTKGDFAVIVGPSGSGKTTLLNLIGGLDQPTTGEIIVAGHRLSELKPSELIDFRMEHVGFVFQSYNLIPVLTAAENVALVTEIATDPMRPEAALELVGLGSRLHHFPAQLSGGEQQRVAIARAIAKRPDILLCDEPTGALDSATGVLVLEAIERIHAELGTTTVLITHNAVIAEMADRVLVMGDGHIQQERRPQRRLSAGELSW